MSLILCETKTGDFEMAYGLATHQASHHQVSWTNYSCGAPSRPTFFLYIYAHI